LMKINLRVVHNGKCSKYRLTSASYLYKLLRFDAGFLSLFPLYQFIWAKKFKNKARKIYLGQIRLINKKQALRTSNKDNRQLPHLK
jgi:hypothetical protein